MRGLVACCLLGVLVLGSRVVFADTLSLVSKIPRKWVCLPDRFHGHVSEFTNKQFHVHVLLNGCKSNRRVPLACQPYIAAKERVPAALADLSSSDDVVVLEHWFEEDDVTSIQFNNEVGEVCPPIRLQPRPKQELPVVARLGPAGLEELTLFSKEETLSLGIKGEIIVADWMRSATTEPVKQGSSFTFEAKREDVHLWPSREGKKVALVALVETRPMKFERYVLEGVVQDVTGTKYTMSLDRIVEVSEVVLVAPGGQPVQLGKPSSVNLRIEGSVEGSLRWLAQLRGLADLLPLELRRIRSLTGSRLVEVVVPRRSPPSGQIEVLRLMRSP